MSKKRAADKSFSQKPPAKKLFQFKEESPRHLERPATSHDLDVQSMVKKEKNKEMSEADPGISAEHNTDEDVVIPDIFLQAWEAGKGCPSVGCKKDKCSYNTKYHFKEHWIKFHKPMVEIVFCPSKSCQKSYLHRNSYKEHAITHPELSDSDIKNAKTKMTANSKYIEPVPPNNKEPVVIDLMELEEPESLCSPESITDEDVVIPDLYLQAWKPGKGCPSLGCKGNGCTFTKKQFKSHWIKFHKPEYEMFICPLKSCQKSFRSQKFYKDHLQTHRELSDTDIKNAKTEMTANKKYIKPLPPNHKEKSENVSKKVEEEEDLEMPATAAKFWQNATSLMIEANILNQHINRLQLLQKEETITAWVNQLPEPSAFIKGDDKLRQDLQQNQLRYIENRLKLIIQHLSSQAKEKSEEAEAFTEMAKRQTLKHHPDNGDKRIKEADTKRLFAMAEQRKKENGDEVNISNIMGTA